MEDIEKLSFDELDKLYKRIIKERNKRLQKKCIKEMYKW